MKVVNTTSAATDAVVRLSTKAFTAALAIGWIALTAAAWAFANSRRIPSNIAIPLALAFLTEYSFYLLLGFAGIREYLASRFTRTLIAGSLALSALLPYLIYALGTRSLSWPVALAWLVIAAAIAFWFLPPIRSNALAACRDLAFLGLIAFVILSGVLRWIFPAPLPKLPLEVLGHIILIRSGILAVLLLRDSRASEWRASATGIGFVPQFRDLAVGALWFLACVAIATPLGIELGQLHVATRTPPLWSSLGLVLGVFWVLALSEEFFFRGLLQQWLSHWTQSRAAGLLLGAILFAACHLGFRGAFPNWRMASLSLILGLCCGAAFLQAGNIRASMVTHALAVSAWRLLLN